MSRSGRMFSLTLALLRKVEQQGPSNMRVPLHAFDEPELPIVNEVVKCASFFVLSTLRASDVLMNELLDRATQAEKGPVDLGTEEGTFRILRTAWDRGCPLLYWMLALQRLADGVARLTIAIDNGLILASFLTSEEEPHRRIHRIAMEMARKYGVILARESCKVEERRATLRELEQKYPIEGLGSAAAIEALKAIVGEWCLPGENLSEGLPEESAEEEASLVESSLLEYLLNSRFFSDSA
ncbi:hypothetical protein FGG08_002865 [Glutinoglossum americanum]|uniref:Uncharacterized protein n=1 Tax=Glutinoglossum americanum TaxID=1670608 RepID=A0A9P8I8R5_9PEZI|nr:hypothetical protein FGG08_002865 [Glutinoglossum americanum]